MTKITGQSKKRKKKKLISDYDYESLYMHDLAMVSESFTEMMLRNNKISCAYVTKTIKAGNQFEVEIYPAFAKKNEIPNGVVKKGTSKAQRNLNDKNAKKAIERKINANFTSEDIWMTLTYIDETLPESMEAALKNMKNYIRRLNYRRKKDGLDQAKYIYVTEWTDKVRCHHHVIMDGKLPMDVVEKMWTGGKRTEVRRLDYCEDNGLTGMAKYLTKDPKGKKRWCASKNLKEPKESKSFSSFRNSQVKKMVRNQNEIGEMLEKKYPKYAFKEFEIKFNDFNGKFYIYARMKERKITKARI